MKSLLLHKIQKSREMMECGSVKRTEGTDQDCQACEPAGKR